MNQLRIGFCHIVALPCRLWCCMFKDVVQLQFGGFGGWGLWACVRAEIQKQLDLCDMGVDLVLLQWRDAWLNEIPPIFPALCPCSRLCVCSHLKKRLVFLYRDLASGFMCLVKMNTTQLWFGLFFPTVTLLQISHSLSLSLIVSLYQVLMSIADLWCYKSSAVCPSLCFCFMKMMCRKDYIFYLFLSWNLEVFINSSGWIRLWSI